MSKFHKNPANGGGSFIVKCDCGNQFKCYASRWNKYSGKGCGKCFRKRAFSGKNNPKYKHGGYMDWKNEYSSYTAMMRRCYDKSYPSYRYYGGRGIKVCERWSDKEKGFENFINDMKHKPTPRHSIDRINNDGDYTPNNCRWATQKQQVNNSSKVRLITIDGQTKNLSQWINYFGIGSTTYYRRRRYYGWSIEKSLKTPTKISSC